jgi:hypothetical protein
MNESDPLMADAKSRHARRSWNAARSLRWTARIWSAVSVVLLIGFIIGEGLHPSKPSDAVGLFLFPFGISAGMILAWWREGLGGVITVGSLVAFYLLHLATAGALPAGWAWIAFAAPGFLFILSACMNRPADPRHQGALIP